MVATSFSFSIWPPISRAQGQGAPSSVYQKAPIGISSFPCYVSENAEGRLDAATFLNRQHDQFSNSGHSTGIHGCVAGSSAASAPRRYLTDQPIHPHIITVGNGYPHSYIHTWRTTYPISVWSKSGGCFQLSHACNFLSELVVDGYPRFGDRPGLSLDPIFRE